jgi:LDH2 family malate/lactate/ureidoglycolate dehydrogenase
MILQPADELRATATAIFRAAGADPEPTSILVNHLIDANLAGHDSHGVQHIPGYVEMIEKGIIQPNARPTVIRETPVSALVDGQWTFGQVSVRFAIDQAIAKARASGVAVVGVVRCTHIGRLGTYSTLASREGVFAMITTGNLDGATVVPFGGRKGIFGTNPFSFGFPAGDCPDVMVDFATSAVAAGKLEVARAKHERLAPGILLDRDGNPTTDPEAIYQGGMLLPFGGHKGSALATLSVLLAHVLVPATDDETFGLPGTLIVAIDVGLFRDRAAVERETDGIIDKIKSVPPAPGFGEVQVPGEPEVRAAQRRSREGIPIPGDTWAAIIATAQRLGVSVPVAVTT